MCTAEFSPRPPGLIWIERHVLDATTIGALTERLIGVTRMVHIGCRAAGGRPGLGVSAWKGPVSMYANLVTVRIDIDLNDALKDLREQVVPRVKQAPGLVAGYWLEPRGDNEGTSIVVFETEEQARNAAQMVQQGSNPMPGVTVVHVETREVVASL